MPQQRKSGLFSADDIKKLQQDQILESQEKFPSHWHRATGTTIKSLQLERIPEGDIENILIHGYPNSTWVEPEPTPPPSLPSIYGAQYVPKSVPVPFTPMVVESDKLKEPIPIIVKPDVIVEPVIVEPVIDEPVIVEPVIQEPVIDEPVIDEPVIDLTTNAGMVLQSVNNFEISNGRLTGSINFKASDMFNPHYYNTNLINYLQISTITGKILKVKENRLRFGISNNLDLVETINYDESTDNLDKVKVESFVWTAKKLPMSAKLSLTVDTIKGITEESKTGFMGAGWAVGAIAGLVLLGFIADYKGGK